METRHLAKTAGALIGVLGISMHAWAETASAETHPVAHGAAWERAAQIERRAFLEPEADPSELSAELRDAAAIFLHVAEQPGGDANGFWRAARAEWLAGEFLPLGEDDAKVVRFERAEALAQRGIDGNPECGECMLWKYSAMGRLATTKGLVTAIRQAREMRDLLDRGIELEPTHSDGEGSSSLGNLHYAAALFYRIVPDSIWVKWLAGVRGDKERALAHSREALDLHPSRLDYRVEVGTQLLCIGTDEKDRARLEEGQTLLATITELPGHNEDERREIYFAKQLLEKPDRACGYTGDDIIDVDAEKKHARK